jgi:hypothetical protein
VIESLEEGEETDVHALIGVSLVLGFVFMLLVDQCAAHRNRSGENEMKSEKSMTATLGLVVHAAGKHDFNSVVNSQRKQETFFVFVYNIIFYQLSNCILMDSYKILLKYEILVTLLKFNGTYCRYCNLQYLDKAERTFNLYATLFFFSFFFLSLKILDV